MEALFWPARSTAHILSVKRNGKADLHFEADRLSEVHRQLSRATSVGGPLLKTEMSPYPVTETWAGTGVDGGHSRGGGEGRGSAPASGPGANPHKPSGPGGRFSLSTRVAAGD
ncbi:hypothetical protein SKAU_G00382300 [Synaphobranchus kaupii]|uniref:Uncharacterized protein n=1 Tax=Synaphobranchus kaupii TaxID=118154 RepID=A0A9Q1EDV6_SYNKA|nr:hypothetical protein SKAU_G00382300 [Synaphobranchus kaupii]